MNQAQRLVTNVEGEFYVTTACIDCDTCRQLAPDVFTRVEGKSAVTKQPTRAAETAGALHSLLACPTGAIRTERRAERQDDLKTATQDFPMHLTEGIYYCGFTSGKSYGGSSYLITHPDGNWLIDAPRWQPHLVQKFEELGGISTIFLTHQDDVADADKYAKHFNAKRIIHIEEKHAQPDAEILLQGCEPIQWAPDFRIVVTPGHTRGHLVLFYKEHYLFSGDHLAWDLRQQELKGHEDFNWYSVPELAKSMEKLADESFDWLFPGHGARVHLPQEEMKSHMDRLVQHLKSL